MNWHTNPNDSMRALFSEDGHHRYSLERWWKPAVAPIGVLGLNPSTASHLEDDPTIRRCVGFAKREGAGGLVMANLSPFRATSPTHLYYLLDAPPWKADLALAFPPDNQRLVFEGFERCTRVIVAYGALSGAGPTAKACLLAEAGALVGMLRAREVPVYALGVTADGSPRHPLYVRADAPLQPWCGAP